jgi:hypothetical protein
MQKTLKVLVYFQITVILLLINLTVLSLYSSATKYKGLTSSTDITLAPQQGSGRVLGISIEGSDARSSLLKVFIKRYQPSSPFFDLTDYLVTTADTYQIDFRLIPAIAMCESNLGARMPSKDSFNAWGIAVYTGQQNGKKFNDWEHAIDWVGKFIREKFYNRSITDLEEIGAIWAPPSVANNDSWARCVTGFMDKIR